MCTLPLPDCKLPNCRVSVQKYQAYTPTQKPSPSTRRRNDRKQINRPYMHYGGDRGLGAAVAAQMHKVCHRLPGRSRGLGPIRFPKAAAFLCGVAFFRAKFGAGRSMLFVQL
jgi:hypothetical protein